MLFFKPDQNTPNSVPTRQNVPGKMVQKNMKYECIERKEDKFHILDPVKIVTKKNTVIVEYCQKK